MASAAATMLVLLMIVYIILLLFFITFIPYPQLTAEYETLAAKMQGPIVILGIIIALSLICVLISLHRPKNKRVTQVQNNYELVVAGALALLLFVSF